MKSKIAVPHRIFQRHFFAVVAGLMFCTMALHAINVRATESRSFSIIGNPALATYKDVAHDMHTVASNEVRIRVTPAETFASTGSSASTERNNLFARTILLANFSDSAVQTSKFNARSMDSASTPPATFPGWASGQSAGAAIRSTLLVSRGYSAHHAPFNRTVGNLDE